MENTKKNHHNFAELFPEIAVEWDYDRNSKKPEEYSPHSNVIVFWKCIRNHSWEAKINNRVSNNNQCPICAGKKVLSGENDFVTLFPEVAAEWDTEKNGNTNPSQLSPHSNKKVWWKCCKGHEWQARISHRTEGTTCPCCSKSYPSSDYNLSEIYPALLDFWDFEKNVRKPNEFLPNSHFKAWWKCSHGHSWDAQINSIVRSYKLNPLRNGCPVCSGKRVCLDNCLPTVSPELFTEWDKDRNDISPYSVTIHSNKTVWWKCKSCGYEWPARINNRANGNGCPSCHHFIVSDHNRLSSNDPDVALSWNYKKNGDVTPDMVSFGSNITYWWICPVGHEWESTVANRSINGHGCPFCAKRIPIKGQNDLATENPELASQWHPNKNGKLTPEMVLATSTVKVWWQCKDGHSWRASVYFRNKGSGCPNCVGKKIYIGKYSVS